MRLASLSLLVFVLAGCASHQAPPPVPSVSYETAHQSFMQGDVQLALQQLQPLAAAGDPRAQRDLGVLYISSSVGTSKSDFKQGRDWFQKAATGGDAEAQFEYGRLYALSGNGPMAHEWYQKAADQGLPAAEVEVGKDFLQARAGYFIAASAQDWFNKAAAAGDPAGTYYLGYMYLNGIGVTPDHEHGMALIQQAARQGDRKANLYFVLCYRAGNCGFPADAALADQYSAHASEGVVQSLGELGEAMKDIIDSHKVYPKEAVIAGQTGYVLVSFECPDRQPQDIKINHSSGARALDKAAELAVASSYFPERIPALKGAHHFVIAVNFQLGGSPAPALK